MNGSDEARPDPEQLLQRIERRQARERRGRLKIWLGAAPGVGKTFAMLTAARRRQLQGQGVVVGWVDTHGRVDTAALLQGLETLPRARVEHQGRWFEEFDLAAALARRPALVLVDELAHGNAPGSRFGKRWQDVEALRDAGIDVETTLNVQHVESLGDVVQKVTGVTVRETVPDHVVDGADEVVLVDLAPDALLERLRTGKVYLGEAAAAALGGFFRKGNLTALRELALRRTAQWVDAQLLTLRAEQGVQRIWGTAERVLVAVGPSPLSARLVRAAHRTAVGLRAELFAVFVADPARELSPEARDRVAENLRLATSLGARTATLEGDDAVGTLLDFARQHDVARIVVGKSGQPRWREALFGTVTSELIRRSGEIDIHVVRGPDGPDAAADTASADAEPVPAPAAAWWSWREFGWMLVVLGSALGIGLLTFGPGDPTTEAMLLVLAIVLVSLRCRRTVAVLGVLLAGGAFNFFFTEPRFSFTIDAHDSVVAFLVMLGIGAVITSLVQSVRQVSASAVAREREVAALYSLVRELADAGTEVAVAQALIGHLRDLVVGDVVVLVPQGGTIADPGCVLASHGVPDWLGPAELGVARWCFDQGAPAGAGSKHLPGSKALFLPLAGQRGRVGVVGFRAEQAAAVLAPHTRSLLATGAEQAALAFERLQARAAQRRDRDVAESERLRSTLLASVSHDLRTPLTSITGAASSLLDEASGPVEPARRELLQCILQESQRLNDFIGNLLFATRFEAGEVSVHTEWTSLEEAVGAALRRARPQLGARPVQVVVAPAMPLVQGDPVLLEHAVFLLLDNVAHHTPPAAAVRVQVFRTAATVGIEVADDGPGVEPHLRQRLFQRFERGSRSGGMGLGLSIGAAIAKAHGGTLELAAAPPPGAAFQLSLPLPNHQPSLPAEASDMDPGP